MKRRWVVGIDPGKRGAVAFLSVCGEEVQVHDMPPDAADFLSIMEPMSPYVRRVFIEKQQPFPQQGLVSTGKLMRHYGELVGVLTALRIPYEEVSPRKWQRKFLGNGGGRRKNKERSLSRAKALFPSVQIGRKDGRADALLIAEYGRRILVGGGDGKNQ